MLDYVLKRRQNVAVRKIVAMKLMPCQSEQIKLVLVFSGARVTDSSA